MPRPSATPYGTTGQTGIPLRSTLNTRDAAILDYAEEISSGVVNVAKYPYNASGGGTGDQTTAIQDAIDDVAAAGGGTVFFPRGTYRMLGGLTRPATAVVNLEGEGDTSVLWWPSDLGSGSSALGLTGTYPEDFTRRFVRNLKFLGPGGGSVTLGTSPAAMQGPRTISYDTWENVYSTGFKSGISITGHHETIRDCLLVGNYFGLYWAAGGTINTYDHTIDSTVMTANAMSSAGVAAGELIGTSSFVKAHFGFSPYCLFKETTTGTESFIDGTVFKACTFEQYGNGVIKDESFQNQVVNCEFVGCFDSNPWNTTYKIAARAADWQIESGHFSYSGVRGTSFGLLSNPGAAGIIRAGIVENFYWEDCTRALEQCSSLSRKPIEVTGYLLQTAGRAGGRRVIFALANAAFAVNDVLFSADTSYVSKSGSHVVGVAASASSAFGQIVGIYTDGDVTVKSSGSIAAGEYIRPSGSSDGAAITAGTGHADSFAIALAAASGGTVAARLRAHRPA